MPKRSLNLHENAYESEESDTEETDFILEDYMEHPKTKEIIENQLWEPEIMIRALFLNQA